MGFINKQNDRLYRGANRIQNLAQSIFKLAFNTSTGLQQPHIQQQNTNVFDGRWHITFRNADRQTFNHSGLTNTGFARQDGVVLTAAHQGINDLPDFLFAADHRIQLTFFCLGCHVRAVSIKGFISRF